MKQQLNISRVPEQNGKRKPYHKINGFMGDIKGGMDRLNKIRNHQLSEVFAELASHKADIVEANILGMGTVKGLFSYKAYAELIEIADKHGYLKRPPEGTVQLRILEFAYGAGMGAVSNNKGEVGHGVAKKAVYDEVGPVALSREAYMEGLNQQSESFVREALEDNAETPIDEIFLKRRLIQLLDTYFSNANPVEMPYREVSPAVRENIINAVMEKYPERMATVMEQLDNNQLNLVDYLWVEGVSNYLDPMEGEYLSTQGMDLIYKLVWTMYDELMPMMTAKTLSWDLFRPFADKDEQWSPFLQAKYPEFWAMKEVAEEVFIKLLTPRFHHLGAQMETGNFKPADDADLLDRLILGTHELTQDIPLFLPDGSINMEKVSAVSTNILEILFASAETTTATFSAIVNKMANNPDLFGELKNEVVAGATGRENDVLTYKELSDKREKGVIVQHHNFPKLMMTIAEALAELPPAPITLRKLATEVSLSNGVQLKEGDTILFPLGYLAMDQLKVWAEAAAANGEEFRISLNQIVQLVSFLGGSVYQCPGGAFAAYELAVVIYQLLTEVDAMEIINPEEVYLYQGSTAIIKNQRVQFQNARSVN